MHSASVVYLSTFSNAFSFEAVMPILFIFHISIYRSRERNSGLIRTLVAIATYILQRLIMGKVEIDSCFLFQLGYLDVFTEMFIEYSSRFHRTCPNRRI